jgi:hypothetical protein
MLSLKKAKSFLRAVWSFVRYGDAPLRQYTEREEICLKCPEFDMTETNEFCKARDCPRWAISDLRTKRRMRDLRCPLNKW